MAKTAHPDDNGAFSQYVFPNHGLESMRIVGEWQAGEDGVTRPVLQASARPSTEHWNPTSS